MDLSGELLRRVRVDLLHLSQEEAAERLEVTRMTVKRWEYGESLPQPFHRRKIEEVYGNALRSLGVSLNSIVPPDADREPQALPDQDLPQSAEEPFPIPLMTTISGISVDALHPDLPEDFVYVVDAELSVTNMIQGLWTAAFLDHLTCDEKRHAVRQAIRGFDAMNTNNQNYQITRREAMRALAALPFTTLGLNVPGNTIQPKRYGDAIAHCTAALEGCWELYWNGDIHDMLLAFQYVSKYLPLLKTIAKDAADHRSEALGLATRYALLKKLLGERCAGTAENISYAKDAVALSKETGDISLQLSAYVKLGRSYFEDQKWTQARATMQEGESVLKDYLKTSNKPPLPSNLIGCFYSAYALVQTKNGESPDRALGIATDSEPGDDPVAFMIFQQPIQLLETAVICCQKSDQVETMKWIAKLIDPETLAPCIPQSDQGRIQTINTLVRSMLKSPKRDMKKIIDHWATAINEVRTFKHELGFSQAVANFEAMEFVFPGEKSIQDLRPLTVHWKTAGQIPCV